MTKKLFRNIAIAVAVILAIVLLYPMRSGKGLQDATADAIAQQVPYALDILAARYPVKVGLARTWLSSQVAVDKIAQDYVRSSMKQSDMGWLDCYVVYYSVTFDKEDVRQAMADRIEKELGLG